jgi:hypothetical protein
MIDFTKTSVLVIALLAFPLHAQADEKGESHAPQAQFELIRSWEGRWQAAETDALKIVFEKTARGTVMVERWETVSGLHSMTIYHMDGEALIATHYCPQGNQPRLESRSASSGEIRFAFRDVTDLDAGESHTHDLWFTPKPDGTMQRSEVYRGEEGLQAPSSYSLTRLPAEE